MVKSVATNGEVRADTSPLPRCVVFQPDRDNWGLTRISTEEALPENSGWPQYRFELDTDVDIYILDTGILTEHEEFRGGRATWAYTATDIKLYDQNLEFGPNHDYYGHGTHVAATAAGIKYGVAKNAKVISVKVLSSSGSGSFAGAIEGLIFAANTANDTRKKSIINMSLGGGENEPLNDLVATITDDFKIPVVSAAGNANYNSCYFSPASAGGTGGNGITVAASNRDDEISGFSNYGRCVDVIAPGENIRSAHSSCDSCYRTWDGTSMATPHVTGVLARYMAATWVTSAADLKAWITSASAADKITIPSYKNDTPNLLLQARCFK